MVFIKTEKVTTSSVDMDSVGHPCASPSRTGALDRMGSEELYLSQDQNILLDAVTRACKILNCDFQVIDVSKYGILQRMREKGILPRLEYKGRVLTGLPTSNEIVEFFEEEEGFVIDRPIKKPRQIIDSDVKIESKEMKEEIKKS